MRNMFWVVIVLMYVAASSFLETEEGGRLVPADILLLGISVLVFAGALLRGKLHVSAVHMSAIPMMVVFFIGVILSSNKSTAAFELVVILFCFVGSLAIADLLIRSPEIWIARFSQGYILVLGALSTICLIDFLIMPGLISSRALGGLQGPFRNTGQAGSFFGVHAAICIALILSGAVPRKLIFLGCVAAVCLALLCTLKRASSVGFVIGIFFLTIQLFCSGSKSDKKVGFYFTVVGGAAAILGSVLLTWAVDNVSSMRWRFESKFSSDVVDGISEGFIADNIRNALIAFSDSPVYGVGLNGVTGVYQSHEIHSTYFAIIAYGGILGVISYSMFMIVLTRVLWSSVKERADNCYGKFLAYLFPLFLGLLVSWGYTTHWRKREFWLLVVFIVVFSALTRRLRESGVLAAGKGQE